MAASTATAFAQKRPPDYFVFFKEDGDM